MKFVFGLAVCAAFGSPAFALEPPPEPLPVSQPITTASVAAGAIVQLELAEPLSSKLHKRGDRFAIRLAAPIETAEGAF